MANVAITGLPVTGTMANASVIPVVVSGVTSQISGSNLRAFIGTPNAAGANTQIQFNNANAMAGSANLTFNNTTNTLSVTTLAVTANANVGNITTTTGRLKTTAATGYVFDEGVARVNIGNSATIVNVGGVTTGIYVQGTLETYGNLNSVGNLNSTGNAYLGNAGNVFITGGTSGQVLSTDGTGNLSWASAGGGGTPAGSNTQIQFNDAGSFGASANLMFNSATKMLYSSNATVGNLVLNGTTNAASSLSILLPPIANIAFRSPMPTANGAVLTVVDQASGIVNWGYPDLIDSPDTTTYVEAANSAISMTIAGNLEATFEANTFTTNNIVANGNITGNTNGFTIGYLNVPQVTVGTNATFALEDAGKHYYNTTAANFTLTVPNNTSVAFSTGTAITVVNQSANTISIAQGSGVTMYVAGNATSGNRSLGAYGMATIMKVATNTWFINGTGVA